MPFKYNPIEGIFDIVVTDTAGGASTSFNTDSGTATPASGVITVSGGSLITTSGSGSTVTVAGTGAIASSFPTDSGTATVSGNALQIVGGGNTTTSASGNVVTITSTGGGSLPPKEFHFPSEGLGAIETNFAPLTLLTGTNVKVYVRAYDDTTEEYNNGKFMVPSDIDTSGTVTFRAYVSAATAAASKNIGLTFGHLPLANSEDWDPASPYTDEDSGATAIDATQDDVTLVTWTETVSNLGWAGNDMVLFRISRDTSVADNLTGDMYLFNLQISIPRA